MKLSEADFRPKQRARRVPSGTRRKIPVLRILILVVAATLVYKRFDSFWPGSRFAKNPHSKQAIAGNGGSGTDGRLAWVFSKDSSQAILSCGRSTAEECCDALETLKAGLCGNVNAVLQKARSLNKLDQPVATRITVKIQSAETGSRVPLLVSLEGRDKTQSFRYSREPDFRQSDATSFGPWCDPSGDCLVPSPPRTPLVQGRMTLPDLPDGTMNPGDTAIWTSHIPEVFPILPGTVSRIDSLGTSGYRIVLYHGKELYTTYEPLRRIVQGLKIGSPVSSHKPLGEAATDTLAAADSKHTIQFQIEQGGMPLDPEDFFAIEKGKSNGP